MIFSLASLKDALPSVAAASPEVRWWIAFSGGLDSCVLLHALAALKLPVQLQALHVNHQISANANAWQQHCAEFCAALGVQFTAVKVIVENNGRGLEDAARNARYTVFEQHLKPGDYLFTGHHADDQSETILLRLVRGAGPRGLAAMSRSRLLGEGIIHRPLLDFTRSELETYAHSHQLVWVNDESNEDDHYDRNYLRNQVMPLLRSRWPGFAQKWQQTAELCAANEALIEELAAQDLLLADLKTDLVGTSIALPYFSNLSVARRHNLLRTWLRGQGLCVPEQQHLTQIENQIIGGQLDAETRVNWGDVSLRVYRARVYALPLAQLPVVGELQWVMSERGRKPLLNSALPNLHIRYRQGGERCRPAGRAHSQTLKRLLQDYAIAPWLREGLPLLYSDDILVAVADLWICEGYVAEADGYGLQYKLKHL
ncbi:MAG: tRNA lysidine(34) synthetase TilS [Pseudomonadota bacterium]